MGQGTGGKVLPLPRSDFGARLAGAGGRCVWVLEPGMGFGDLEVWWREGGRRDAAHEGLDLLACRGPRGRMLRLAPGSPVPAPWEGQVAAVVRDFIGASVFLRHEPADAAGWRLHSVLGHLDPGPGLVPGRGVAAGEIVGVLAPPRAREGGAPAHLHLSLALVAPGVAGSGLDWAAVRDRGRVRLLDPAPLLGAAAPLRGGGDRGAGRARPGGRPRR